MNLNDIRTGEYNSIIIGSGAAGLNCAIHLAEEGIIPTQIAIITDNLYGGTSFNSGSDKQTYYKMSIIGDQLDSPYQMAKDLFAGGAMHGDIALIEATNSVREFFHLIQLGVPFPYDRYGSFVGYKTDNDLKQRATSIGPFTSQEMCKCLLKVVQNYGINILDKYHATKILLDTTKSKPEAIGLVCMRIANLSKAKDIANVKDSVVLFKARNIIVATGGPAILYKDSVYPESQKGTLGLAIDAGCKLQNLTESQFGLASLKFRWNVSGSYQQVIPRYFSIDEKENEIEFLRPYFPSFTLLSKAIFLKGYQWPFSSERIENYGSSLIDLAVYNETEILGRKVFLDYRKNSRDYDFEKLDQVVKEYLIKCNAVENTPIQRLRKMNEKAIVLYQNRGIDLSVAPLQISVCNQHLNGGVSCDIWWESSSVKHLFFIGEVNGSHGIHRPGGAALNAGQVGGLRAAQKIGHDYNNLSSVNHENFLKIANFELDQLLSNFKSVLLNFNVSREDISNPSQLLEQIQNRMSKYGGIIRPMKNLEEKIKQIQEQLSIINRIIILKSNEEIIDYLRVKDALLTQLFFFKSILNYHESKGKSRGSYLILRDKLENSINERHIQLPNNLRQFNFITSDLDLSNKIQVIYSQADGIKIFWENVREIPRNVGWFENVWKEYSNEDIYK